MECKIRPADKARRNRRCKNESNGGRENKACKASKCVSEEEQVEETRAEKMRGVGRTRPAENVGERVTEERVSMKAKEEDLAAKENSKRRGRKRTMNGSEWRQIWGPVVYIPRPCRSWERKRRRMVSNGSIRKKKRF